MAAGGVIPIGRWFLRNRGLLDRTIKDKMKPIQGEHYRWLNEAGNTDSV